MGKRDTLLLSGKKGNSMIDQFLLETLVRDGCNCFKSNWEHKTDQVKLDSDAKDK